MLTLDELYQTPTPKALRVLRERYDIGHNEMARRVGWNEQGYRRYEDTDFARDGLPGDLYGRVRDVLLLTGASRQEVWALVPEEVRTELLSLHDEVRRAEQRLDAVRSALDG
jgi:hypothetical protein